MVRLNLLSRARCSVERAFSWLKSRFGLLYRKLKHDLNNVINIGKAATILHKLCIDYGENIEIDWETLSVVHKNLSCNTHTNCGIDACEAFTQFFVQDLL